MKTLQWHEFNQNNSGGSFIYDADIGDRVFIQAGSASEATEKAERLGVYFDGCEDGRDCGCCGDRWSRLCDGAAVDTITPPYNFHGKAEWMESELPPPRNKRQMRWYAVAHYADGRRSYMAPRLTEASE